MTLLIMPDVELVGPSYPEPAFGPQEFAAMLKWAEQMEQLGNLTTALRLRWRAHCASMGRDPQQDPAADKLFIALEEAAAVAAHD